MVQWINTRGDCVAYAMAHHNITPDPHSIKLQSNRFEPDTTLSGGEDEWMSSDVRVMGTVIAIVLQKGAL
ncbi:hypothetical protein TNCV_4638721 [Trichonephila clavipes]|uniref:Uncharacterized protein n=1 Tax=Trichonephila clavipes TaxID=2585209 RepID=A0A8X6WEL5_TRICX|nr:hypothetical protein TNCV_4638721 [Trichonephila clavipes]